MDNSKSSDHCHSVTHGFSHSHTAGRAVTESEYMTGTADHTCTGPCARIHLGARLREFEQHLHQISTTLPVQDFLWYRDSITATFTTIWKGTNHA